MPGIDTLWVHAHNILRSARQILNEELESLGLSSAEGNILLQLLSQGDSVHQEDIGERLDISKPAVSRAVNSLEAKGYLARTPDARDRRATLVLLTGKAKATGPHIESIYQQLVALAAQGLSPEEIHGFTRVFERVSENFTQARKRRGCP
ncbi:MAG: MarR family transcriptional regulator [Bacillota bacterium]